MKHENLVPSRSKDSSLSVGLMSKALRPPLKKDLPIFCYNFMHLKRVASETDKIFCDVCKEGTEQLFKVQI